MKYAHTNIVAQDWRKLADFYITVFACEELFPRRDLKGAWIEEGTGVAGARIQGAHLRLPGHRESGPTLEIFQYNRSLPASRSINREGLAHLAFQVGTGKFHRVAETGVRKRQHVAAVQRARRTSSTR
jgi:catechol 2,3-dioxygenase-like lactoylglutathione lyase family enzyme